MKKQSAGILLFRHTKKGIEVMLAHPGGPFFSKKDAGVWSIPKGEFTEEEDALAAAKREFLEEIGQQITGEFIELKPITQKSGKVVYAWAVEGDLDVSQITSNTFTIEWPPNSGKMKEYPEMDKAGWFSANEAKEKINPSQYALIEQLLESL